MKTKLSILWIIVMLNLIFADILSIFIEIVEGNTLNIIGSVKVTMAVAAIITNIPILMIYYSRVLNHRLNKRLNIFSAVITIIFVIGGGSLQPHYIICAGIEVIALIFIIRNSINWTNEESSNSNKLTY